MSIDLGSQWIKMALVKPGVSMEIVLNEESGRKTPNVINIKNNERFFGDEALSFSVKHYENSFTHLVDLLGKKFDNPVVALYKQRFPFLKIIPDDVRNVVQFDVDGDTYNIETLIAMILKRCQKIGENYAKQEVRDVVITVPAFFNQAERRAVIAAAKIAELNLLQLLSDHVAAGLSYGVFRRKEISEKSETLLIYDVGASKVTASVLEYAVLAEKKEGEKDPVMTTLGVGYNRMTGGLEITQRLRDIFVNHFRKSMKTKSDITKNPRAMAKMLQEAERVLSANVDYVAQIENVHENHDFMMHLSRTVVEDSIMDLEGKLMQPIIDALKMAEISLEKVDHVVLMGGGSRVPLIQEFVQKFIKKKEVKKFLNTDEAIAVGAVYQAAYLSKGFKVKKFGIRDLQMFPIQVDFMSANNKDEKRIIHRPIYPFKSFIPASKKLLSFTSFVEDFSINVNYGEIKQLSADQIMEFGSLNISEIRVEGVADIYSSKATKEGIIFKSVKTLFNLDGSGMLHADKAEILFEQIEKAESTFASLAGKITGLFSSNSVTEEENEINEKNSKSKEVIDKDRSTNMENQAGDNVDKCERDRVAKRAKNITNQDSLAAEGKIKKFEQKEEEKANRDKAHNELESYAIDLELKLNDAEFIRFLTSDELAALQKKVSQVKIWVEEETDISTPEAEFVKNKRSIDDLMQPIKARMKEEQERPLVVADLISLFNHTEIFLLLAQNLSESTEIFTKVEINSLAKLLHETKDWLAEKIEMQSKLKPTDPPVLLVSEGKEKLMSLDREVNYLLNKMKFVKPKVKKQEKVNDTGSEHETLEEVEESRVSSNESETSSKEESIKSTKNLEVPEETIEVAKENKTEKEGVGVQKTHDESEL
ncbi:unnamed protein product [Thelazia callipaeda]|uniref:Hypoxia up-regulated protein 1 n=1 Tax=Thelazia callipaeda TaxID=103827 RepID=A0A0N5D7C1_THECL|nr:unnamed protein product [Thelazia callipaeda]